MKTTANQGPHALRPNWMRPVKRSAIFRERLARWRKKTKICSMEKTCVIAALICAALVSDAQTVSVFAGGGAGAFNSKWKHAAPVACAGIVVDDPIGERSGIVYGLAYKQRAESAANTLAHVVQFDVSGRYTFGRFDVGAGGFFALAAGTRSDQVDSVAPILYGSGVGATAFVWFRLSDRLALRVVYDHGLTDLLPEHDGTTTAQGVMLSVGWVADK